MLQSFNGILSNLTKVHNYYVTNKADQTKVINYLQQAIIDFKAQRAVEFSDYLAYDLLLFCDLTSKALENIATAQELEALHLTILKIRMQLVGLREQKNFLAELYKKNHTAIIEAQLEQAQAKHQQLKTMLKVIRFNGLTRLVKQPQKPVIKEPKEKKAPIKEAKTKAQDGQALVEALNSITIKQKDVTQDLDFKELKKLENYYLDLKHWAIEDRDKKILKECNAQLMKIAKQVEQLTEHNKKVA